MATLTPEQILQIYGTSGPTERLAYNLSPEGLQNPDIDSSTGGMTWTGDGPLVTIDGKQYMRLRTNDPAAISSFDAFGGGVFRDPTHGYVVPLEVASARTASSDDFIDKSAVALAGAGLAAGPMAASMGATGAAGATEGAFTPDFSGYLTGIDTGPGFLDPSLTSGLEGAAGYAANPALGAQQAVDGSMQTIYDQYAAAGLPGYNPSLASTSGTGGLSAVGGTLGSLGNILGGNGGLTDWLKVGGSVLNTGLGMYSANQQAGAYEDMFNKYFGAGAPFRGLLQQSYQPGFDISKEPGFQNAMDTALDTYMRAASAGRASGVSRGNPYDSPGAMMESQKYLLGNLALPYLQNYRSGLTNAGQLGFSQSVPFGAGQIQAQGNMWEDLGYGIRDLTGNNPNYGIQLGTNTPFNPNAQNPFDPYQISHVKYGGLA